MKYTDAHLKFLRENYPVMNLKRLTAAFNARFGVEQTVCGIKGTLRRYSITSGRTGCFEKGCMVWNTGTKGLTSANVTSFAKGNVPANRKPLGTERYSKEGYIEINVSGEHPYTGAPTRYRCKHVVLYEKGCGKVPRGMVVAFRDGDKTNCVPENLIIISRSELLGLNRHNYRETPDELKASVLALVKLEVKASCRGKSI